MVDSNNNTHVDTHELDPADGQQYVEELRDHLLEILSPAQTIEEVNDRLHKLYPDSKLTENAIDAATKSRSKQHKHHKRRHHSTSSSISFTGTLHSITSSAVAMVSNLVREGVAGSKSENEVTKYKMALIEYIIKDVLDLAADFVKRQKNNFIITRSDIRTAMHADKDLLDMFLCDDKSLSIYQNHPILAQIIWSGDKTTHSYHPSTTHHHHHHNQSHPNLTYKQKVRNMVDSENSFIRGLKLIIKVFKAQLEVLPQIKDEVKIIFCGIDGLLELSTLLLTAFEEALDSVDPEAKDEVPYVGSEIFDLAQAEEFHAYFNFAYKRISRQMPLDEQWRQAYYKIISDESTMNSIRTAGQPFDLAVKHLLPNYLLNTIIQFFEYYKNICDLYELSKQHNNREDEFALKQTISILIKTKRAIETLLETELEDKEIEPLDERQADSIRAFLEKRLDAELKHERNLPLKFMPPPEIYRFSEPDSKDNIIFEDSHSRTITSKDDSLFRNESEVPVIRCATLIKLVERLTYHKYQPTIVDCFLTTYRSFISDPAELLDLLIERFKIPDPPMSVVNPTFNDSLDDFPEFEREYKQYLKRFRQEYSKPVKMRVINVLKSWVRNHYYDFERHPTLLNKLHSFLDEVYQNDKVLRSLINSLRKSMEQKKISQKEEVEFMHSNKPPRTLWDIVKADEPEKFSILTLNTCEFARQLTLVQFDLFRAIRPSELINVRDLGLGTKKDDKYESSPNLSRMTRHFTLFSYWIRKCIVECEDLDTRATIYRRTLEIMGFLRELNNFTGLLSVGSAIESAPIVRLALTKKSLPVNLVKVTDDYRKLNDNHQRELQLELKSCNPPCIPYLGSYQTKLIHAKEGNKTFIDEVDTNSPSLSNDEFQSSFSNSPATPISPRTPLPRTTPSLPPSATSTLQNQFFGGGCGSHSHNRPVPINIPNSNCPILNDNISFAGSSLSQSNSSTTLVQSQSSPFSQNFFLAQQPPPTPAPPKMINFTKQLIRAKLVGEISNYQNQPYCLTSEPEIRKYIESIEDQVTKFALSLSVSNNGIDSNGTAVENNVPALTKRLDDYLFEQSEKIEPKNTIKPPKLSKWKSQGNKVSNCTTPK